jgi:hypothetical protein
MLKTVAIDLVADAIFSHRLWAIGEEGRLTLPLWADAILREIAQ